MRAFKIALCTADPDFKVWWGNTVFVEGDVCEAIMKAKLQWLEKHNEVYKKQLSPEEIVVHEATLVAEGN